MNLDKSVFLGHGEEVLCHSHVLIVITLCYVTTDDYRNTNVYHVLQNTSVYSKPQTFSLLLYCNILAKNVLPLQLLDQKFSEPEHT